MSTAVRTPVDVEVRTAGPVPSFCGGYAARKIASLGHLISRPVLSARVRLTQSENPSMPRPAIAQATLNVNGRVVRAHVASATMREAVDALEDRLRDQLERLLPDWRAMRTASIPGQRPLRRRASRRHPDVARRPVDDREIVRRKTVAVSDMTADEAAYDLELLDYDFYLFRHLGSGQHALLYRASPLDYRIALVLPEPDALPAAPHLTCSSQPAPRLTDHEAAARLDHSGAPFVFFVDALTGHPSVLYHRYDGHYGLITCAD